MGRFTAKKLLHSPKSDYDGVLNWPQNILLYGRGSERPVAHTQQKLTQVPLPPRGYNLSLAMNRF